MVERGASPTAVEVAIEYGLSSIEFLSASLDLYNEIKEKEFAERNARQRARAALEIAVDEMYRQGRFIVIVNGIVTGHTPRNPTFEYCLFSDEELSEIIETCKDLSKKSAPPVTYWKKSYDNEGEFKTAVLFKVGN